ncbi:hypothetical protein EIP91_001367 [Steccherinum ochraceum]|uniref:Uncharacterized protein n=1 Tax=Steccherinum ochraceum TaxID=92696 RepID=A0A4R0RE83_9APHY|nr:hypothetical protein EIP91_001367 [Steccherinum ochraceum]
MVVPPSSSPFGRRETLVSDHAVDIDAGELQILLQHIFVVIRTDLTGFSTCVPTLFWPTFCVVFIIQENHANGILFELLQECASCSATISRQSHDEDDRMRNKRGTLYAAFTSTLNSPSTTAMNLDKSQRIELSTGGFVISDFRKYGDLVRELAKPTGLQKAGTTVGEGKRYYKRVRYGVCHFWESGDSEARIDPENTSPLGALQKLPVEIRAAILHHTQSLADLYCFSAAHDLLFNVGYEVAKARYIDSRTTWIGDRIIYFTPEEGLTMLFLPDGLLTPEEAAKAVATIGRMPELLHPLAYFQRKCIQVIADARGFPTSNVSFEVRERLRRAQCEGEGYRWTKSDTRRMEELLAIDVDFEYSYKSICPWNIYNLSKGEYIRGDAFLIPDDASASSEYDALACNADGIGLGAVLMSRILWGPNGAYANKYVRGVSVWAGDRFAIAPSNHFPALNTKINGGQWKDASGCSLELLRRILLGAFTRD